MNEKKINDNVGSLKDINNESKIANKSFSHKSLYFNIHYNFYKSKMHTFLDSHYKLQHI